MLTPKDIMRIRLLCKETKAQFAKTVGVGARIVAAWEQGTRRPNTRNHEKLLELQSKEKGK